jgi:hypothetical protein
MNTRTLAAAEPQRRAVKQDPVVLYDIMRESATRLIGSILSTVPTSAPDAELDRVNLLAEAVHDEARNVPIDDVDAIVATTVRFKNERDAMLGR